ncbi:MAG: DNA polymerase-3 subunit delta' [Bermanella sp.]|jgi:DNA polymerase-3 subunit delta'|uniref:AAA family ATPase n=1 Tax=Glaciecola sp. 33A TaxID=2057807 RepID=UPI000C32789E|nr:AAA family ATPase [Glaciecola sp. 33A]PKI00340.1 DNA polymerase III subunit delta [Glaciecola sp. 33A]
MYPWLEITFNALMARYRAAKLHHGLLFMGVADAGKTQLCHSIAKALLCKSVLAHTHVEAQRPRLFEPDDAFESPHKTAQEACGTCKSCLLIDAGSHPDLHVITTDKSQIGIDAIRQTIAKVTQTSQLSGNKVVIISQIELMSESASNALLKTLEEPTPNTYLLMTTNESQRLLATILSRCEKQTIALPSYDQSCHWLRMLQIPEPSKAALIAHGSSPITYRNELENADSIGFDDFVMTLKGLIDGSDTANRAALKWHFDAPKVAKWLAQHWLEIYKNNKNEFAYENYQACLIASKRMSHPGLNKSLILTSLFTQLRSIQVASFH